MAVTADDALDRIERFHNEVIALSATSLPLDRSLGRSPDEIAETLAGQQRMLRDRLQRGESIQLAIETTTASVDSLRLAYQLLIRDVDSSAALDTLVLPAAAQRRLGHTLGFGLLQPLIVLTLVYFGFLYLCTSLAPRLEAIYAQLWRPPSASLSLLVTSRHLIPVWATVVPVLLVVAWILWRWRITRGSWKWLPGSERYFAPQRHAIIAQQLAMLLDHQFTLSEALSLLTRGEATKPNVASSADARQQHAAEPTLPPLLSWATSDQVDEPQRPATLRMVADFYRQLARRQAAVWRFAAPTVAGVLLASVFVFLYGLCLFVPVVQLLKDISVPGGF